ncbi:tRNA-dependent cyclodipeptide synthase [Spirillospora sp. CA-128828]|uniref:tRNA-dependent cyclodipeptide synthase n=1 Tax=Spirillospora sp. CA-128828 TaxID=3240033 RepID=UPI003D93FE57
MKDACPAGADSRLSFTYLVRARGDYWRTQSHCRLPVSIGQAYHEGDKLRATVDWVNRHAGRPFRQCTIVLADSLHRHNLQGPHSWSEARATGDSWLNRNSRSLTGLIIPHRIVRWDDLLQHPEFPAIHARMNHLVVTNPAFANALHVMTEDWLSRRPPNARSAGEEFTERVQRYVLEEISAIAVMELEIPAAICYPGGIRLLEMVRRIAFGDLGRSISWAPTTLLSFELTQLHIRRRAR